MWYAKSKELIWKTYNIHFSNFKMVREKKEALQRTNSPTFLTLFNNTTSVALFTHVNLRTLVSMVALIIVVTVVKH
jgi:hypothetical protein